MSMSGVGSLANSSKRGRDPCPRPDSQARHLQSAPRLPIECALQKYHRSKPAGVGRKTTDRLLALGLLTDPEGAQDRELGHAT